MMIVSTATRTLLHLCVLLTSVESFSSRYQPRTTNGASLSLEEVYNNAKEKQEYLNQSFPRVSLAHLPTPLEYCPRLSEALGGVEIYVKRDDCTGLATGGNKARKLGEREAEEYCLSRHWHFICYIKYLT